MKKPFLISFLTLALLLQTHCVYADLPDLGDIAQATMSLSDEARIGRDAMRAMREDGSVSDDLELNHYINTLGAKLAMGAQSGGLKFNFFIVNDDSINAFAMPGGYIGVNQGLILATQSEGELASVLGHEMAHVTQHHLARMQASSAPSQLLLLATIVAAALASHSGNSDAALGTLNAGIGLSVANQLAFSRDFEREADRVGMQYLTAAGFDAREMPIFFQRLQQNEHLNAGEAYAFLRTHPVTVERISEAQNRAQDLPVRMRPNSTEYLLAREKIRVKILGAQDAVSYYQNALDRKLYLSEGAQWYGLSRAKMQADNLASARQALLQAERVLPDDPMLYELSAEIARAGKDWTQAMKSYQLGLKHFSRNRVLAFGELDLMLQLNQRQQALKKIRDLQGVFANAPALYRLQARAYADQDTMRYHAALGNALYFEHESAAALEQYQLASQAPGDDFYLRSSIEARIQELQKQLADDKRNASKSSQSK